MSLIVGDREFAVGQLGPKFLMLDVPASCAPTNAELIVTIDGDEKRRTIYLPDGLKPEVRMTPIAKAR